MSFNIKKKIWNSTKPYLNTEKTLAIFPIALILFLITSFRAAAVAPMENTLKTVIGICKQHITILNSKYKPHYINAKVCQTKPHL